MAQLVLNPRVMLPYSKSALITPVVSNEQTSPSVIADVAAAMAFCPLVRVADVEAPEQKLSQQLCSFDVFKAPSNLAPMAPEWFGERQLCG